MHISTADLFDEAAGDVTICDMPFRDFGARSCFGGLGTTLCASHHEAVKAVLAEPGKGRVLVVETFGSPAVAVLGDRLAAIAVGNGWEGIIVAGLVRDSLAIATLDIGLKALGTTARRALDTSAPCERDGPVRLGDVTVHPGQWVFADPDAILLADRNLLAD